MSRVNLSKLVGAIPSPFVALNIVLVVLVATLNLGSAFSTYVSLATVDTSVGQAGDWVAPTVSYQISDGIRTNDSFTLSYQVSDELTTLQQLSVYLKTTASNSNSIDAWENIAQITDFTTEEAEGTIVVDVTSLTDGEYQVAMIATDEQGNTTEFPDEVDQVVTIDTTAPDTPTMIAPARGGYMIEQDSFVWSEVESDFDQEVITYQLMIETAGELQTIDTSHQNIAFQDLSLIEGPHTAQVVACDDLENCSQPSRLTSFVVDTTAPTSAATLTNNITFAGTNQISNGSFSQDLADWETRGSLEVVQSDIFGVQHNALRLQPTVEQPALASAVVASSSANQVGFWYKFEQVGESTNASLLVFADETQVLERWSNQTSLSEWQYLQVDTSEVSMADVTFASSGNFGESILIAEVTTAPAQITDNPEISIAGEDEQSAPQVYARYVLNEQEISINYPSRMIFTLAGVPDNGVVEYWAVDQAGNQEEVNRLEVVVAEAEIVVARENEQASDESTPSPSPSPEVSEPSAAVTVNENNVQIELTNVAEYTAADYLLTYEHQLEGAQLIREAITGSTEIDADQMAINDLYLGTCSDTDGVVCIPHLSVVNILLEITLFDINQNELVLTAQQ